MTRLGLCLLFVIVPLAATAQSTPRVEFTRMVAHWSKYSDDAYLPFINEAEPELVQLGFYGAHFWSLAHTPQFGGYPAHFPVRGLDECGQWFVERNRALHQRDIRVIGHFNVEFLVGDPDSPDGPRGFFEFYRDRWDENLLGPRPASDPLTMLERGADGKPLVNQSYSIGGMKEYWACLRNPDWQQVLKAWVKVGIERGLDGFIANYFYRHNCLCEHCQSEFRSYLDDRFTDQELREKLGIANLDRHVFDELVCWHDPDESTPLRREMLRWSQISNKRVFDQVFVNYGRSLKPDLILAQWNHLSDFKQISGDERCLLPSELWGADEDYLWYSTGASANYTDIANGFFGDATLQARYIRGAFDDKPFTLGKYENTRIRAAIAELAANGGAPMGFYTRFTDPAAREVIARYYQFLKRHDDIFRANHSHAEVLLLFPRQDIHQGNLDGLQTFRTIGKQLLDRHVLFDVLPDDIASDERKARYKYIVPSGSSDFPPKVAHELSQFDASTAVRVSASRNATGNALALHFVNYDRAEPPQRKGKPSPGRGITDEIPLAAEQIGVQFILPAGVTVTDIQFATPEQLETQPIAFQTTDGVLKFDTPRFLVYGIAIIQFNSSEH